MWRRRIRGIACVRRNYKLKHIRMGGQFWHNSLLCDHIFLKYRGDASDIHEISSIHIDEEFSLSNLLVVLLLCYWTTRKSYLGTGIPAFQNPCNKNFNRNITYRNWSISFLLYSSRGITFAEFFLLHSIVLSLSHLFFIVLVIVLIIIITVSTLLHVSRNFWPKTQSQHATPLCFERVVVYKKG